jgi:spore maturation protein CgeB
LYRSVDATLFFPEQHALQWDLGYSGGHDHESRLLLERFLIEPARRWSEGNFVVAGSGYPRAIHWPKNVKRISRLPVAEQRAFYNSQRFALNMTPYGEMAIGFSPEARLFEAAACGTPVISDFWPGINTFFKADEEILISHSPDETLVYLEEIPELDRRRMGYRARERVLAGHTTRHRAAELESYALQVLKLAAV